MAQYKNIDIVPDETITRVHLSQGDIGRTLIFYLFENALSWSVPSNSTIKCQGTKPSGFGFSVSCTYSGNAVTCVTTEEMTDEFGQIEAELVITSSDESQIFGTSNFIFDIEKNPHPDNTTDGSMETVIPELTLLVNEVKGYAEEIEGTYHAYGSPWVASTVAQMTDTDKIYVYTGSETGYVNGNWYYHNGSSWVSGGVYNAVAVNIDPTLTIQGACADAKVVGDRFSDISEYVNGSTNKLNPDTILANTQINASGVAESYSGRKSSDYILCGYGDTYYFTGIQSDGNMIALTGVSPVRTAFYNANKQFISAVTWQNSYTINVANVAYMRICWANSGVLSTAQYLALMFSQPTSANDIVEYEYIGYSAKDIEAREQLNNVSAHEIDKYIIAWGDSRIANGVGATSVDWYLKTLLGSGWNTINKGYGSQGSGEIAFTMGVNEVYVSLEGNVISSSSNTNRITNMRTTRGSAAQNFMQNSSDYLNGCPCDVHGYAGYIYRYNGTAYFVTTNRPSSDVSVAPYTRVFPTNFDQNQYGLSIIWAGKNDFSNYTGSGFATFLKDVVSQMGLRSEPFSNRYVILGETASATDAYKYNGSARVVMDAYNNAMAKRFPDNFIDIQKELMDRGLDMAEITPTQTDLDYMAVGWLPDSLMSDETHQNATCRNVIAQIIYEFMQNNGWI